MKNILKKNIALSRFTNYSIGGPAEFFFASKNEGDMRWALKEAKKMRLPVFILGGGTNVLVGDEGIRGLVLKPEMKSIRIVRTGKGAKRVRGEKNENKLFVTVGAGAKMSDLLKFCVKNSLSGLEWAGGLPGTVGGALRGNAGCFGGEIKDVAVSVRSLDPAGMMKIKTRSAAACRFDYRMSIWKKSASREIILGATLLLTKGIKKDVAAGINEKIVYRKTHHPLDYPNIGSIFKNIPLSSIYKENSNKYNGVLRAKRLAYRGSDFSLKTDPFPVIAAAKLISETGLRGVSAGGAMISGKHPNFIVNVLDAKARDVNQLITLAKSEVRRKFGLTLEEEVQIV